VKPENYERVHFEDSAAIRADIERSVPFYAGIAALAKQGDQFQWGGPRLCGERRFPTTDGKAHFSPVRPADLDDAPRPVGGDRFVIASRRGKQFNSMVQAEIDDLTGAARDHVFVAPKDAQRLGLARDTPVEISNELGKFEGRAFLAEVAPGTLQGHWPEINVLFPLGPVDPEGGVPDYNATVRLAKRS
jgi:anaerobic selenocysteine-containing dehydrogenase